MLKIFVLAACLHAGFADLQSFVDYELVPDVLATSPVDLMNVTFSASGVQALEGNVLALSEVTETPTVSWNADSDAYYTLIFPDPDATSRADPIYRSYLHWLVVNIPGDDVTSGQTVVSFVPSGPPPGTGLHRYVFLAYKQSGYTAFEDMSEEFEGRILFSADDFAEKYNLGTAVAGNFYQTENTTVT